MPEATDLQLGFAAAIDADMRRYNAPQGEPLAVLFESADGAPPGNRDLLLWPRRPETPILRASERNEHIDPLTYTLLFPEGTPGWHDNLLHADDRRTPSNQRLTAGQFYAHRLMVRDQRAVLPHGAGLLFQQYILDGFCRAESMRMAWVRLHQRHLRSESRDVLEDFVAGADVRGDHQDHCGARTVLPSSFAGSPRHMYQLYLDAMAIVRTYGRPAYFITFTANPNWPEIRAHLLPHQRPVDRPDLVARAFHMRLRHFLKDLTAKHWLGCATA